MPTMSGNSIYRTRSYAAPMSARRLADRAGLYEGVTRMERSGMREMSPDFAPSGLRADSDHENRSAGGAISVTRSRSNGLLASGASVISRGSSRAVQA